MDESMELPPLKSEGQKEPAQSPGLRLKTQPSSSDRSPYSGRAKAVPEPSGSPPLSPIILSRPAAKDGPEKLPLKPVSTDRADERPEDATTVGKLPADLKPLSPVEAPGRGLKMSPAGRKAAPGPFAAPEIPLLAEDQKGPMAFGEDSPRKALTLKPASASSQASGGGDAGVYTLGTLNVMDQTSGSDMDEKLIAIYEKYYKDRK